MRFLSPRALPTLAAMHLLLACQPDTEPGAAKSPSQETPSEKAAEQPRSEHAWSGVLEEVESSGLPQIEIKRPESKVFEGLKPGSSIQAGSIVRTGPGTRARMRLDDAQGVIALNHSSELHLRLAGPGIDLKKGHAVVTTSEDPKLKKGLPEIGLPTGRVELLGTRVSALAGAEESSVMVAHGKVRATLKQGHALQAQFGQELVLPKTRPARVDVAPDLERTFGWSEIKRLDESLPTLEQGMGKLVARPAGGGGSERRLDLTRHKIRVRIQGMMAYTEITETFYNPSSQELEGLYRFPLPENAQISRLALRVGDTIMEGQFLETARAERIWRDIIESRRDPALLKWKQGNQFELRIFPILARDSRQVTIGYVQRLEPTGDGYRYTYPMPVDRSGQSRAKHFDFKATIQGHDPGAPLELEGYDGATLEPVANPEDQAETKIALKRKDFQPSGDLSLRFGLKPATRELRTYTYRDKGRPADESYMVMSLRPEFGREPEVTGRDFVVILDNSYSNHGVALKLQRELAARLVEEMDPMDQVRVLACSHRCQAVGPRKFRLARSGLAEELRLASEGLEASGSTSPVEALRAANRLLSIRDTTVQRAAHIIYITDGIASAGAIDPAHIQDASRRLLEPLKARISVVHIGGESDGSNLKALARAGRGAVVKLSPGSSMTGNALRVLRHHYGVSMRDIAVELPAGVEQVYPTALSSLLPGEEILLVGRFGDKVEGSLKLRGHVAGKVVERAWPLVLKPTLEAGNSFAPRLWAKHRIEDLELQGPEQRREIIRLSKRFGILTRYTSLLALESEEMMREFNVRRQRHIDWKGKKGASTTPTPDATSASSGPAKTDAATKPLPQSNAPEPPPPAKVAPTPGLTDALTADGSTANLDRSLSGDVYGGMEGGAEVEENNDNDQVDDLSGEVTGRASRGDLLSRNKDARAPRQMPPSKKSPPRTPKPRETNKKKPEPLRNDAFDLSGSMGTKDNKKFEKKAKGMNNRVGATKSSSARRRGTGGGKGMGRVGGNWRTYKQCYDTRSPSIGTAAPPTRSEERRIESRRKAHERDPRNRTKRMRYIRALMRGDAPHRQDAQTQIAAWLETNAMDPEAVALQGQVLLNEGRVQEAMKWLTSAPDAAARANWIQRRVQRAYRAIGDEAMACATDVALQDIKARAKGTRKDILACPMATPDTALLEQDVTPALPMARPMQSLRGRLLVTAEWSAPVDLDLVLVEPSGRLLSWMSQRKGLKVAGVRSTGFEQLAMPRTMSSGSSLRLVRVGAGVEPIAARVTIKHGSSTKTLDVTVHGQSTEIAELGMAWKQKCEKRRVWEYGYRAPKIKAKLSFGSIKTTGGLDRNPVTRIVRRNAGRLRNCYERSLKRNPNVAGAMVVEVTVGGNGRVQKSQVRSNSVDGPTGSCVSNVLRRLRFPTSGQPTTVAVPLRFRATR